MNAKDAMVLAGVGFVAYVAWKSKAAVQAGADAISKPIAYIISKLTLPPSIHINGGAVLPDGGYVSWDAIRDAGSKVDANGYFSWRGVRYKVKQRRTDGNYDTISA